MSPRGGDGWRQQANHLFQRLNEHQDLRAALSNFSWLMLDKLVRIALGLFVGAWVARYLGPSQYGELAYVIAFIGFFQAITTFGADAIVVREIACDLQAAPKMLGTITFLRVGMGLVCWVGAIGAMALINGISDQSVILTALVGSVLIFQAADTIDLWFQSQSQSRRTIAAKFAAYLCSNAIKILLVVMKAPLVAFAAVVAMDSFIAAAGLIYAYRHFPVHKRWLIVAQQAVSLLRESWPFLLSGLAIMVYMRIDQILIKEYLGTSELGVYAAALTLSQIWLMIPMLLSTSLSPFMAREKLRTEEAYKKTVIAIFRAFFLLGLVCSLFTYLIAPVIIPLLYGELFKDAISVLQVHVFSNIFCFLGVAHSLWLTNERKFAVRLYGTIFAGAVSVIVNVSLIPRLGLLGACYAAIICQFVAAMLINAVFDREGLRLQLLAINLWGKNALRAG